MGDETATVKAYEHKAAAIVESAKSIKIVDDQSRQLASKFVVETRAIRKEIEDRRKEITGPLNQSLKKINSMFKDLDQRFSEAQGIVDGEIKRDWLEFEGARLAAEELHRAEAERMAAETGGFVPNMVLPETEKTITTDSGSTTIRKDKKITLVDKAKAINAMASFTCKCPKCGEEIYSGPTMPHLLVDVNLAAVKRYVKATGLDKLPGFLIEDDAIVSGRKA